MVCTDHSTNYVSYSAKSKTKIGILKYDLCNEVSPNDVH